MYDTVKIHNAMTTASKKMMSSSSQPSIPRTIGVLKRIGNNTNDNVDMNAHGPRKKTLFDEMLLSLNWKGRYETKIYISNSHI